MEEIRKLVEVIVKALVNKPDKVRVLAEGGSESILIVIEADKQDYRRIIGKKGETINQIRSINS